MGDLDILALFLSAFVGVGIMLFFAIASLCKEFSGDCSDD